MENSVLNIKTCLLHDRKIGSSFHQITNCKKMGANKTTKLCILKLVNLRSDQSLSFWLQLEYRINYINKCAGSLTKRKRFN